MSETIFIEKDYPGWRDADWWYRRPFDTVLDDKFSQLAPNERLRPASDFPESADTP